MSDHRVLPASRREYILSMVNSRGSVRVSEVAEALSLAPITIRRDIAMLAEEGLLEQVRGGARRLNQDATPPALHEDITVGVVTPSLDFFWPTIIGGINTVADRFGARVQLQGSTFAASDNLLAIRRMAEDSAIDGLLLVPDLEGSGSERLIEYLETITKPTVLIERDLRAYGPSGHSFESVVTDHRSGAALAVRHLAGLGHRRIALITDKPIPSRHLIAEGWSAMLARLDLDTASPREDTTGLEDDERSARIEAFIDTCLASGTTAFLIHSDEAALVAVDVLTRKGVPIPEQVSVIAYDDELAGLARPALTAVCPPKRELGVSAMQLLFDRLEDADRPGVRMELTPSLVVRDSTGPASY
ncbi:substrate-binding domain-containing protein [Actinomyces sp. MRS3W]|uniref:substrate-binding domain-containing protein n=1 Tax=Actinomyces sp. MRS3W TaxID=2800796 RepID=UPI0028FD8875|nr:substrate-binding domain-containing protein [Actinomyces sp. MRS3W]MDU0348913.1 substrate-binding domain-containing protein [Actinomyces sp. MRS3W]